MFWVYVLENPRGKFYVGQTANIVERVRDHNRTDCFEGHFTRKNGPWKLVQLAFSHPRLLQSGVERMSGAAKNPVTHDAVRAPVTILTSAECLRL
jgi:hypothetical protein